MMTSRWLLKLLFHRTETLPSSPRPHRPHRSAAGDALHAPAPRRAMSERVCTPGTPWFTLQASDLFPAGSEPLAPRISAQPLPALPVPFVSSVSPVPPPCRRGKRATARRDDRCLPGRYPTSTPPEPMSGPHLEKRSL